MVPVPHLPQLRIAVNSRCGRHCVYCRPAGEAIPTAAGTELDSETVLRVTEACAEHGIREVKLTGGDPAIWTPLLDCATRLKRELGVGVQVISRHPKLGQLAEPLAVAGVDLFNVSLDTLDPDRHRRVTGIDDHDEVVGMVKRCVETGVPTKVNVVVMAGENDGELGDLIEFCEKIGVKTIKLLDVIRDLDSGSESYAWALRKYGKKLSDLYTPLDAIVAEVRGRAASVKTAVQGGLGHPMTSLTLPSGFEVLVKDHARGAWYGPICEECPHYPCHDALMALRLTADARLQFCLLREDKVLDLRPWLGIDARGLQVAIRNALTVYAAAEFHHDPIPRPSAPGRLALPLA